jgi:amino acid efflux transporter
VSEQPTERPGLSVVRGGALYAGALIGPGLLLVPALAAQTAGAASILAWGALLVLSAPLAITFAALGVRHPVAGGVSAYVREGFGDAAAAVTGGWFLGAVMLGAPAVSLIGGYYVADLERELPRFIGVDAYRSVPRRPLIAISAVAIVIFAGLVAGIGTTEDLVRATSALFIAVYVLAISSAIKILAGAVRVAAFAALVLTLTLAVFSAQFLLVPVAVAAASLLLRHRLNR